MGLALLSMNLGVKGACQTLFSLASLLMTGIYCRPTVSHKSEVWADTLGCGDREPFLQEIQETPTGGSDDHSPWPKIIEVLNEQGAWHICRHNIFVP